MALPKNPEQSLWDFCRFLTCSTVMDNDQILIIVNIPLIDAVNEFYMYKVHSLPLPLHNATIPQSPTLVALHDLEVDSFAITADNSRYVLLSTEERQHCLNPLIDY